MGVLISASPCPLLAQNRLRNPFGVSDVPNPDGDDVAAFAASLSFSKDDGDMNAALWTSMSSRGLGGWPDGKWASRWSGGNARDKWIAGEATVVSSGERVYIYYKDDTSGYLIDTRREGSRLVGRYVNTRDASDSSPWVGEIVSEERIDGAWKGGRWDLRRRLVPLEVKRQRRASGPPRDGSGYSFAQQVGFARELFRGGRVQDAANMVREAVAGGRQPDTGDPRDRAFARALVAFIDGDMRSAFDEAQAIHAAGKAGQVNIDAALLKSLVFLEQGILPLAAHWRKWAADNAKPGIAEEGIAEILAQRDGPGAAYKLDRTLPHAIHAGHSLDVWHGSEGASQAVLLVLRKGADFRGAFALDVSRDETTRIYDLRYYDLEGERLTLTFYGKEKVADDELVALAQRFDPRPGTDGYTVMRAEVQALYWQRADVAPYAAEWADRAAASQLVAEHVEQPLQAAHRGSWELRGREPFQADASTTFEVARYVNSEFPDMDRWSDVAARQKIEKAIKDKGPIDHFHLALVSPESQKYLGSFVLESSEPISGMRLYYLSSIIDGERRRLRRYDEPLTLARVIAEAKEVLQEEPRK